MTKKVMLKTLLLSTMLFVGSASANGWLIESTALGTKDVISSFKASLLSEELNVVLGTHGYTTEVIYTLGRTKRYSDWGGEMIFPVLCSEASDEREISGVSGNCISSFEAYVDGRGSTATMENITSIGPILGGYKSLVESARLAAVKYSTNGIRADIDPARVSIQLRKFSVFPESEIGTKIVIRYSAPYYSYESGFTKSSFFYYSNDIFFYDFSPAIAWALNGIENLKINIDVRGIYADLIFSDGYDFQKTDKGYSFAGSDVDISKLPPLIIAVESRYRKQYEAHRKNLKSANLDWNVSANGSLKGYPAENAMDGDIKTAWCITANTATIKVVMRTDANKGGYCRIEGLAVMNGYNKSELIYKANRRIKDGTIYYSGVEDYPEKGTPFNYFQKFSFIDMLNKNNWSPYTNIRYFVHSISNENFRKLQAKIAEISGSDKSPDSGSEYVIKLDINDVFQGDKYEDLCVSEIYPVINCP